ncbi:hypothetical protein ACFQ6Q_11325 [Streptomyces sp. NPDC056437]
MAASSAPDAGAQAAELLRLSDLLDARRSPQESVPGIYINDETRRF